MEIALGDKVRDRVNGFEGIALARLTGLYEATSIRVHRNSLNTSGEMLSSVWIEEERLESVTPRAVCGFAKIEGKR
jgi:hypothetical protein